MLIHFIIWYQDIVFANTTNDPTKEVFKNKESLKLIVMDKSSQKLQFSLAMSNMIIAQQILSIVQSHFIDNFKIIPFKYPSLNNWWLSILV